MSTTAQETPSGEALRLFTQQDEKGQVDSTLPIRWCISPDVAEMIKQKGIRKPKLVIVVEHSGQEKDRYVVPLEDEMRFIQLRSPGKNTVHATMMWDGINDVEGTVEGPGRIELLESAKLGLQALEKQYRELNHKIWPIEGSEEHSEELAVLAAEREGLSAQIEDLKENEPEVTRLTPQDEWWNINRLDEEVAIDVIAPEELFAKKPPRWMKWLGSRLIDTPPRDQCQLRRRAIGAGVAIVVCSIPLLIAFMAIEVVNLAYSAVLLLFGMRSIDYAALRHPFTYTPKSIGGSLEPSFWTFKKGEARQHHFRGSNEYEYTARHRIFQTINPPAVVIFTAIGFGLYLISGALEWLIIGALMAFALGLLVLAIGAIGTGPFSDYVVEAKKRAKETEAAEQKRKDEEFNKEIEDLSCGNASREASVSALPKNRQTVSLRFQNLKTKVCRPFAS